MATEIIYYLSENKREWSPPAILVFDTESYWEDEGYEETHKLRCWVGRLVVRRDSGGKAGLEKWGEGTTVDSLCDFIEEAMRGLDTLWCFAHNLQFDIGLTRLIPHLTERGWEVLLDCINPSSSWWRLRKRSKHLTLVDSFSWLPVGLETVAQELGMSKTPLPTNDADMELWMQHCRRDVEILSEAMLQLLRWWDRNKLGSWSITGPASGFNAMRHRRDFPKMLITASPELRRFEREALYGGRREIYKYGQLPGGLYEDWDMKGAYPSVARDYPLPVAVVKAFKRADIDKVLAFGEDYDVIARVRVRNARGEVPVRIGQDVWYPAGEFVTVLAGPEIRYAVESGCEVEVGEGYFYRMLRGMAGWAKWILSLVNDEILGTPRVVRIFAKHMSRAVIGKFAGSKTKVERIGQVNVEGWWSASAHDVSGNRACTVVYLDGVAYAVYREGDADTAFPAVLAFVEAHTRVRLHKMIRSCPFGEIVHVDTDGFLMRRDRPGDVVSWAKDLCGVELKCKNIFRDVLLLGPQHVFLDEERRLAGVPRDAHIVDKSVYVGRIWPGLKWQLRHTEGEVYVRKCIRGGLGMPLCHGWILSDGRVIPVVCGIRGEKTVILRPEESLSPEVADMVADEQCEYLCRLCNLPVKVRRIR